MKIKNLWKMPSNLGEYAKEIYRRIGPKLAKNGQLQDIDYDLFISLCENYHLSQMALQDLKKDGVAVNGGRGVLKKHPSFAIYKISFENFEKLCRHFGLSPMSRGEKFIIRERPTAEEKKIERFFKAVG